MAEEQELRRRFPRVPSQNAVLVSKLDESGREELSKIRSVGIGGCMFTTDEAYGVESVVEVLITIGLEVVKTKARVVWERQVGDRYEIGVEFLEVAGEDRWRIAKLLESARE